MDYFMYYKLSELKSRNYNIVLSKRGQGHTIVAILETISRFANDHEYEYIYEIRKDNIWVSFYNSPSFKSFEANVSYKNPIPDLINAFKER